MINNRITEITENIDKLTIDLLVPLRGSKYVNKEAFDKLYLLLDELVKLMKDQEVISRKLAGLLFFIYTSVSAEAEHAHYASDIFMVAANLEDYLDKILWDSPFSQGGSII